MACDKIRYKDKLYSAEEFKDFALKNYFNEFKGITSKVPGNEWYKLDTKNEKVPILLSKLQNSVISKEQLQNYNNEISNYFGDNSDKEPKASELLSKIASDNTYLGRVAQKFLDKLHNDVPIKLLSIDEAANYLEKDGSVEKAKNMRDGQYAGFYSPKNNEIVIVDRPNNFLKATIIHEIGHALTWQYLKTDGKKELQDLLTHIKDKSSSDFIDKYKYQLKNIDEFFSALSHKGFIQDLEKQPSVESKGINLWQDIKNWLSDVWSKIFGKDQTLLDDYFKAVSNTLENAYKESDNQLEPELADTENQVLPSEPEEDLHEEEQPKTFETKLSKTVDDFFNLIQKEKNLLNYGKYSNIKEIFENPLIGNDYKRLYELLKQSALKTDEGIAFEKKVKGFNIGLEQLKDITSKFKDNLKTIDFSKLTDQEALSEFARYLTFLNEQHQFVEALRNDFKDNPDILSTTYQIQGNINTAKDIIFNNQKSNVFNIVEDILKPTLETQKTNLNKEVERLTKQAEIARKDGREKNAIQYEIRIKEIQDKYKKTSVSRKDIIDYLTGNRGDASAASAFFEAFVASADPITYAAKVETKNVIDQTRRDTYQTDIQLQRDLKPLLKELGYSPLKGFDFFKQFTQEAKAIIGDEDWTKLQLLHEFTNDWEHQNQTLRNNLTTAKAENDLDKIKEAQSALNKFLRDYMFQQYSDEYYDRFELFEGELGEKTKQDRDDIFAEMNDLQAKINKESTQGIEFSEEELAKQEELIRRLRRLSSLTDENGQYKTGEALEKAKIQQEYALRTRDIVEWKQRPGAFQNERDIVKNNIKVDLGTDDEKDPEFIQRLKNWDDNNLIQVNTKQFYEDRQKKINRLTALSDKLKKGSEASKSFSETWEKIFDQLKGYRDDSNQVNGTLVTEPKKEVIKDLQEQLEVLKSKIEGISGLLPEENEELNNIWQSIKNGSSTPEMLNRKKELEDKKDSLGLRKEEKDEYYKLIKELSEMQIKAPTEHYLDQLNTLAAPTANTFDIQQSIDLLKDDAHLNKMFENEAFKNWWEANHIRVWKFDKDFQQMKEQWERLYIWSTIIPFDDKYTEKTTLSDGTILQGKPASKYFYRDIQDKYKTPKIVGVTTDNRGNFLPKSYSTNGELLAKDTKYLNQDFYNLKNAKDDTSKAKFKTLSTLREYLLKAQESLPYEDRLWLDIPRVQKHLGEIVRSDQGGLKQHFKDKLNVFNAANRDNEQTNARTDLFGTELVTIPVKYKGKIDYKDVSLDLPSSIIKYTESTNMKRALTEVHPFIKALEDVLEAYGYKDISKIQVTTNKLLNTLRGLSGLKPKEVTKETIKGKGTYRRLENIRRIEKRDFQGIYKEGIFSDGRNATSDILEYYLISPLTKVAALGILAGDFTGAAVNQIVGNTYGFLEGMTNRTFTLKDFATAGLEYNTKVIPSLIADSEQELGTKSFYGQLIDMFDPQQDISHKLGTKYTNSRALTSIGFLEQALINPREFGEHQISTSTMLAILNNHRVKSNGEFIALKDAYELLDGKIALKADTKFSKADFNHVKEQIRQSIREAQGNYANMDKTELERYAIGRLFFFMRRFLVPVLMDAYGANRFNGQFGNRQGYFPSSIKSFSIMVRGIKNGVNNWDTLSRQEKGQIYKGMSFLASTFVFAALINFLDSGNDKEKYNKTKRWSYSKIQALFLAIRVKNEVEQVTPLGGYNNMTQIANSPFMIGRKASQLGGLAEAVQWWVTNNPKNKYSDKGGYRQIMEDLYGTDKKSLVAFYKLIGYRGGGLQGQIPGTQKSKDVSAYRLKTTAAMQRKN